MTKTNFILVFARFVPQKHYPAHPDAFAFGGGDLVANSFRGHLANANRERTISGIWAQRYYDAGTKIAQTASPATGAKLKVT
jgi:hypothetical protein